MTKDLSDLFLEIWGLGGQGPILPAGIGKNYPLLQFYNRNNIFIEPVMPTK
jgi:hypothetical protein